MMRIILSLVLALFAGLASAQTLPPCWPKQLGSTGSDYKRGTTADGDWAAWTCTVKGARKVYVVWAVSGYEVKHPNVVGMTPIKTAGAYWRANVTNESDERGPRLRAAARAAFE